MAIAAKLDNVREGFVLTLQFVCLFAGVCAVFLFVCVFDRHRHRQCLWGRVQFCVRQTNLEELWSRDVRRTRSNVTARHSWQLWHRAPDLCVIRLLQSGFLQGFLEILDTYLFFVVIPGSCHQYSWWWTYKKDTIWILNYFLFHQIQNCAPCRGTIF